MALDPSGCKTVVAAAGGGRDDDLRRVARISEPTDGPRAQPGAGTRFDGPGSRGTTGAATSGLTGPAAGDILEGTPPGPTGGATRRAAFRSAVQPAATMPTTTTVPETGTGTHEAAAGHAAPARAGFRTAPLAVAAVIAFGAAVRTIQYLHNRSLWVDEALLALNLRDASFAELFGRLDHNQVAPLGFLIASKALVALLGDSEYVLRLLPFLAGLAALLLFRPALAPLVGRTAAAAGAVLFAVSTPAIYYAAELKQYSVEILATLLFLWALALARERGLSTRALIVLAGAGIGAILFSLPSVFVLAGTGGALLLVAAARGDRRTLRRLLPPFALCGVVFLAIYALVVVDAVDREFMERSWRDFFLPVPPRSVDAVKAWLDAPWRVIVNPFGLPTAGLGLLAYGLGVAELWRRDRATAGLLVGPVLATLAAAAAGAYPFGGRVLLFLTPPVLAVVGAGVAAVRTRSRPAAVLMLGLLAFHPALSAAERVVDPTERAEVRTVLAAITDAAAPGSVLYVHFSARPAFAYYRPRFRFDGIRVVEGPWLADRGLATAHESEAAPRPAADLERRIDALRPGGWILFAGDWEDAHDAVAILQRHGTVVDSVRATGAYAYRFRIP